MKLENESYIFHWDILPLKHCKMLEFRVKAIISDQKEFSISSTVYLFNKEKKLLLPIKMSTLAADNILLAEQNDPEPRPHIHDTTTRLIKALKGKVECVIINGYQGCIFYSYIRVNRNGKSWDVDSKPSDSLSIALRLNIPVFVRKHVYETIGIKVTKELLEKSF